MPENPKIISYNTIRRSVGVLGISLPVIISAGAYILGNCNEIQSSVSLYYNTIMRNVFVGILCAVALFMFAYRGYDYRDRIAGISAFVFALGIAFFPASKDMVINCKYDIPQLRHPGWIRTIHLTSATLFFLTLSYFSLCLFTRTDGKPGSYTKQKKKRNVLYRICGFVMLMSIFIIALWMLVLESKFPHLEQYHPVFWLESIALWAFGISWLVKGEVVLKDK